MEKVDILIVGSGSSAEALVCLLAQQGKKLAWISGKGTAPQIPFFWVPEKAQSELCVLAKNIAFPLKIQAEKIHALGFWTREKNTWVFEKWMDTDSGAIVIEDSVGFQKKLSEVSAHILEKKQDYIENISYVGQEAGQGVIQGCLNKKEENEKGEKKKRGEENVFIENKKSNYISTQVQTLEGSGVIQDTDKPMLKKAILSSGEEVVFEKLYFADLEFFLHQIPGLHFMKWSEDPTQKRRGEEVSILQIVQKRWECFQKIHAPCWVRWILPKSSKEQERVFVYGDVGTEKVLWTLFLKEEEKKTGGVERGVKEQVPAFLRRMRQVWKRWCDGKTGSFFEEQIFFFEKNQVFDLEKKVPRLGDGVRFLGLGEKGNESRKPLRAFKTIGNRSALGNGKARGEGKGLGEGKEGFKAQETSSDFLEEKDLVLFPPVLNEKFWFWVLEQNDCFFKR